MSRKRHTPEQIINKLRQAEVELARGATVPQACKKIGVTDQTYHRWRAEYGGMRVDQAKRPKQLEKENSQLKKLLVRRMVELATRYGRYGYRRVTALLRAEGWPVNHKCIERLWRQEGLKVPQNRPNGGAYG